MEKKLVVMGLALVFLGASVFAVGFIGTPTAELNKGQWSIGGEYGYSSQDLEKSKIKGSWADFETDGSPDGTGSYSYKLKGKDFNVNRYFGVLSYGLTEEWEVSARLGLTDIKGKTQEEGEDDWYGYNFSNDFAWGLGTKYTFLKQDKVAWGVSAQVNWLTADWDEKGTTMGSVWKDEADIDVFELIAAIGPTIDMGGWKLYGGAFYYYLDGEAKYKGYERYDDNYLETWKEKGDIEADGNLGAFIGAQFDLTTNIAWTSEFSAKQNGWGLGTGITFKF